METGATCTKDNTAKLAAALAALTKKMVYVGIPAEKNDREDEDGVKAEFGNAAIGWLNQNGSPAQNIPARPHLDVGIERVQDKITTIFKNGGKAALSGDMATAEQSLMVAGQVGADSVREVITSGLMPSLADSTVEARARRGRKGAIQEMANRAAGKAPSSDLTKPLLDTGEYKNNITYVVR